MKKLTQKCFTILISLCSMNVFAEVNFAAVKKEIVSAFLGEKLSDSPDYYRVSLVGTSIDNTDGSNLYLPGLTASLGEKLKRDETGSYSSKDWALIGIMPSEKSCKGCDSASASAYIILGKKSESKPIESMRPLSVFTETKIAELRADGLGVQLDLAEYLKGLGLIGNLTNDLLISVNTGIGARFEIGRTSGPVELFARTSLAIDWKEIVAIKLKFEGAYAPLASQTRRIGELDAAYQLPISSNNSDLIKAYQVGVQARSEMIDQKGKTDSIDYGGIAAGIQF